MSSQTTNIGLTLPAGSENVSRLIINENYTKIDDAVGELNERIDNLDPELPSALFTDLDFTLAVADWTLDSQTGLYNATITNTILLTATAGIQAFYDNSFRSALAGDIYATKSTGYVTFTTTEQPVGTLTGFIRIMDSTTGIVPTDRGGTGASTPRQARENLNTPIRDIFVDFGTVSSLPQTVYDADLRFGMVAFDAVFSNPSAIPGGIEVTFADPSGNLDGSVTITGTISGSTTISFFAHEKRTAVEGSETVSETQRVQDFVQTNAQTLTAAQKAQVLDNIGGASNESLYASGNLVALVDVTVTTTSQTVSLQSGKKLSDYKTLALCVFDGTIVCGSVFISRNVFASHFNVTTNGYSLVNYHAAVICSYSSDTAVQIYAREMAGWTSVRCVLYGMN